MLWPGKYNIALAIVALSACKAAAQDEPVESMRTPSGVSWEAFRASAVVTQQGRYLVEGDLTFGSEVDLYRYWATDIAVADGALTVKQKLVNGVNVDDVWSFPDNFELTYCIGSGFTSQQLSALVPALEAAGQAWSSRAGVSFRNVTVAGPCNSATSSVVFDVQLTNDDFVAAAFWPSEPRSARTLLVDDQAFTSLPFGMTLSGVMTHEFGHALGFRHEHIWDACPGDFSVSDETTEEARQLTPLDTSSVMYYPQCRAPVGGGFVMSEKDHAAAISLYGMAPSLIAAAIRPPM
jgi:serralysin